MEPQLLFVGGSEGHHSLGRFPGGREFSQICGGPNSIPLWVARGRVPPYVLVMYFFLLRFPNRIAFNPFCVALRAAQPPHEFGDPACSVWFF